MPRRAQRDDTIDSSGVVPSSFQAVDSELNLAASASAQSRHEPGTATRRLIFSSVSNSAQFRKNKTEEVDLPQEIRQAAVTLMAVSPAAGSAAHKANIMVSSLFCPYCGERTARDSLLQHLERTCTGVIAASKADHQNLSEQSQPADINNADGDLKAGHSNSRSMLVSGRSQRESVDDYGLEYMDHADSSGSPLRSAANHREVERPVTSIGYRTPEKKAQHQSKRRHDQDKASESLSRQYHSNKEKGSIPTSRDIASESATGGTANTSAPNGGLDYPGTALPDSPVELHPCRHCSRTFAAGRLEVHERVCQRIFGEKRHKYDALNKRTHDTPFRPTTIHSCSQCGRNFAHREEMLVHERACAMGHLGSASASRKKRQRSTTPGSTRRNSRRTPNHAGSRHTGGIDATGLVWGSVSSVGSAGRACKKDSEVDLLSKNLLVGSGPEMVV